MLIQLPMKRTEDTIVTIELQFVLNRHAGPARDLFGC